LDLGVVDADGSERLLGLLGVEGAARFFHLAQARDPGVQVSAQAVVERLGLKVPQRLELKPDLDVLVGLVELRVHGGQCELE